MHDYGQRIDELLADPELGRRVSGYLDPESQFAAYSFDLDGSNPPFKLVNDDLFALNFLDVPIGVHTYREVLNRSQQISDLLNRIDPSVPLWEAKPGDASFDSANELWETFMQIDGFGTVTTHKLMSRKRPHLVPILDRWVTGFYQNTTEYWVPLGQALRDDGRRAAILRLAPDTPEARRLSVLRILDIAIWSSRNSGDVEQQVVDDLRRLGVKGILVEAAEQGLITDATCAMPDCLCPSELGGRTYFEPKTHPPVDWMPTPDHYPRLKKDGGHLTVDNVRLAHRLCNRVDYAKLVGRRYDKDLERAEAARLTAINRIPNR